MNEESKVTVSILNPVLLALKYKSINCLRYLVEKFGLRKSVNHVDIMIRAPHGEYAFRQWVLPILLKVKDSDCLTFIMK
jgi:hypothetical protein